MSRKTNNSAKPNAKGDKDAFKNIAKALGCDEDKARFEAKLGKLAKAKPPAEGN